MEFFDCNIIYGLPSESKPEMPVPNVTVLKDEMTRAGISRALVRREEQICSGPVQGNKLVAEDVRNSDNLWGVWAILPPHTHEIPDPDTMLDEMKNNRIVAWQFLPDIHRFCFHRRVLGTWFELAQKNNIPILVDLTTGISAGDLLNVLEAYPELNVIITVNSVWPLDRLIRPFINEFSNCYIELSMYFGDGTLEDLVAEYGSDRILFGSGFYKNHFGGYQLMLKHAQISTEDKEKIASGNLEKLIAGDS